MNDIHPAALHGQPDALGLRCPSATCSSYEYTRKNRAGAGQIEDGWAATFRIITLGGDARLQQHRVDAGRQDSLSSWADGCSAPTPLDGLGRVQYDGRARILVYLHAGGPGTHWARTVRKGDRLRRVRPAQIRVKHDPDR